MSIYWKLYPRSTLRDRQTETDRNREAEMELERKTESPKDRDRQTCKYNWCLECSVTSSFSDAM